MSDGGTCCPACGRRAGLLQGWRLLVHHAREHRPPGDLACGACGHRSRVLEQEGLRRECTISWVGIGVSLLLAAPVLLMTANTWIHLSVTVYLALVWTWCGFLAARRLRLEPTPEGGSDHEPDA